MGMDDASSLAIGQGDLGLERRVQDEVIFG